MLSESELKLLKSFVDANIPFIIVGMSAALMQGAGASTLDVDLWFKDLSDPQLAEIIKNNGGFFIPSLPQFQTPPRIGGEEFQNLDLVTDMAGLSSFEKEFSNALEIKIDDLVLKVLPLERIIQSKRH